MAVIKIKHHQGSPGPENWLTATGDLVLGPRGVRLWCVTRQPCEKNRNSLSFRYDEPVGDEDE